MVQPAPYGGSSPTMVTFSAGACGDWRVLGQSCCIGEDLPGGTHIAINHAVADGIWSLTGFASNLRYTSRDERTALDTKSGTTGTAEARLAALIPVRKSPQWWAMAQDERHAIYARSAHAAIGMDYLPAIARRLLHSRDLGQPFDFLTWFEFAPDCEPAFDELLARLRATEEWRYVEREMDIRLIRCP